MLTVMRLFSRKAGHVPLTGGLAGRVLGALHRMQVRAAGWLNAKTAGFSRVTWVMGLVLFCLVAGSVFMYLILSSV